VPHRLRLALDFLDALLDYVADRDEADELAFRDHRQVAEFPGGHPLHDGRNRIVFTTGRDVTCHDLTDRSVERVPPVLGQPPNDIAFRQYPGDTPSRTTDQHRADTMRGEQFSRRRQIGSRLNTNDVATQVTFLPAPDRLHLPARLPSPP